MAEDFGISANINVHSGSSTAICISRRRGLGKIRHLAVGDLWVQESLRNGDFDLVKIWGGREPCRRAHKIYCPKHCQTHDP